MVYAHATVGVPPARKPSRWTDQRTWAVVLLVAAGSLLALSQRGPAPPDRTSAHAAPISADDRPLLLPER